MRAELPLDPDLRLARVEETLDDGGMPARGAYLPNKFLDHLCSSNLSKIGTSLKALGLGTRSGRQARGVPPNNLSS